MPREFVASGKPGELTTVLVSDYDCPECEKQEINHMISMMYHATLYTNKEVVNATFKKIYGFPLKFSEKMTGEILVKIKNIMQQTGKPIEQICAEIKRYLGYNCQFYRLVDGKAIPINSERILQAHSLLNQKVSILQVEEILYF